SGLDSLSGATFGGNR
uniref:Tachykinin-related peptide 10 n=1 Tax=Rhyparobia maderae TaxID=36963 RepID=TRPA_RHYMA|nr:RecName: Full=Tachykinin-related peptide 10; Short=LemTRP 10 [Rhyparobia maderae]